MIGVSIKPSIGIGDGLQFSSLPENYYRATGKRLLDISHPWFFDHNPYVIRNSPNRPSRCVELWNFGPRQYDWPKPRGADDPQVYLSNAEVWASLFKVPVVLNRPRLYQFEDWHYSKRELILLQTKGKSHGALPEVIVEHVIKKYGAENIMQIGFDNRDFGLTKLETPTYWDLAEVIARARIFIGPDSGPGWIAACYPDVVLKIVRLRESPDKLKNWVPLDRGNIHSFWDDRCRQVFNTSEEDVGFTSTFRKL